MEIKTTHLLEVLAAIYRIDFLQLKSANYLAEGIEAIFENQEDGLHYQITIKPTERINSNEE